MAEHVFNGSVYQSRDELIDGVVRHFVALRIKRSGISNADFLDMICNAPRYWLSQMNRENASVGVSLSEFNDSVDRLLQESE